MIVRVYACVCVFVYVCVCLCVRGEKGKTREERERKNVTDRKHGRDLGNIRLNDKPIYSQIIEVMVS